ncbi:MAG TPA: hypothetical protein VGX76_06515 [Pirellulales bacterium]|nr:hypothetical protein [Pirellulales bacterium]
MSFAAVLACVGCSPLPSAPAGKQTNAPAAARADSGGESRGSQLPAGDEAPADYLPLSLTSRWEYDVEYQAPLADPRQATAVTRVEGQRTIAGKQYFKVVLQVSIPLVPTSVTYYCKTAAGVFQILDGEEDAGEWLYLPAELEAGKRWTATAGSKHLEFEVLGHEDVSCGDTVYPDCIHLAVKIKSSLGTNQQEQWLAAGVGIVKQSDQTLLFKSVSTLRPGKTE